MATNTAHCTAWAFDIEGDGSDGCVAHEFGRTEGKFLESVSVHGVTGIKRHKRKVSNDVGYVTTITISTDSGDIEIEAFHKA